MNEFELRDEIEFMFKDRNSPLWNAGHLRHSHYVDKLRTLHEWLEEKAPVEPSHMHSRSQGVAGDRPPGV